MELLARGERVIVFTKARRITELLHAALTRQEPELAARVATRVLVLGDGDVVADGPARHVLAGSLFAPQVLRVLPPFLTVDEVAAACPPVGSRP